MDMQDPYAELRLWMWEVVILLVIIRFVVIGG